MKAIMYVHIYRLGSLAGITFAQASSPSVRKPGCLTTFAESIWVSTMRELVHVQGGQCGNQPVGGYILFFHIFNVFNILSYFQYISILCFYIFPKIYLSFHIFTYISIYFLYSFMFSFFLHIFPYYIYIYIYIYIQYTLYCRGRTAVSADPL